MPTRGVEYAYDFGDGWELSIKLEKPLPPEPGLVPGCTAGRREAAAEEPHPCHVDDMTIPGAASVGLRESRDHTNDVIARVRRAKKPGRAPSRPQDPFLAEGNLVQE